MQQQAAVETGVAKTPHTDDSTNLIAGDSTEPGNPFSSGTAQQVAGQYAGQYVQSQFTK